MALKDNREEIETRGLALAALGLAYETISRLRTKGLIDKSDLQEIFADVLSTLPPTDSATLDAIVDVMHALAVAENRKPSAQ